MGKKIAGCLIVLALLLVPLSAYAIPAVPAPPLAIATLVGGSDLEEFYDGVASSDGGYVGAGHSSSTDFDMAVPGFATMDGMVVKQSSTGAIEWVTLVGGESTEMFTAVKETTDLGFIAVGMTNSTTGDLAGKAIGSRDGLIAKIDAAGNKVFVKAVGGTARDYLTSVCMTADGGFVVAGYTHSSDIGFSQVKLGNADDQDALLIKCDANGNVLWARQVGGIYVDWFTEVIESTTGDLYAVGLTGSNTGLFAGMKTDTSLDAAIVKFSADGELQWAKTLGGSSSDQFLSVAEAGGGIVAAGTCWSNDLQLAGLSKGLTDGMVAKYDAAGNLVWVKSTGGSQHDVLDGVYAAGAGNFVTFGHTISVDMDIDDVEGDAGYEAWMMLLDADGAKVWSKTIGGTGFDAFMGGGYISETKYVGFGHSTSNDRDVAGLNKPGGNADALLAVFDSSEPPPADTTPPVLTLTPSTTAETDQDVTITATATDNVAVKQITKPDASIVAGTTTTFVVSADGTYTFIAEDDAGNIDTEQIVISNIDKTPRPQVTTISPAHTNVTAGATSLTVGITTLNAPTGTPVQLQLLGSNLLPLSPAITGTGPTGADGTAQVVLTLPANLPAGTYYLIATIEDGIPMTELTSIMIVVPIIDTGEAAGLLLPAGAVLLFTAGVLTYIRKRRNTD